MRFAPTIHALAIASALGFATACGEQSPMLNDCPAPAEAPQNAVLVPLHLETVAGATPFALNTQLTSTAGASYKVSKFRYYLSQPKLVTADGRTVGARLVSADGRPLPFDVALVDAAKPDSGKVALLAAPGEYTAVELLIGVPDACPSGEQLNHGDASARGAPLDVDSDMYWSWDPGYIHLKIEGKVQVDGEWKSMFFHVGEDARRPRVRVAMPISIASGAHNHLALTVDVNRLFVTEQGATAPDFTRDRTAHGGQLATQVASNIARSGFLRAH